MVLTFLERRPRFCHGYLLESHSITGLDLGKKREVCADHGGYFPVAACNGLHKEDDGLAVSWNLNRTGHNAFGDNGVCQAPFPVKRRPRETNAGSVGLR